MEFFFSFLHFGYLLLYMSKTKIFFYSCLAFIIGVFVRTVWPMDFFIIYLAMLLAFLLGILSLKNKLFLILAIWLICLALGAWRYQVSEPAINQSQIYFYDGQTIKFTGLVVQEPDQREDKVKLTIKAEKIEINSQQQNVKGLVLVTKPLFPEFNYGDELQLECKLDQPQPVQGFDYENYLARYDIYSVCYNPQITLLAQNRGNWILAKVYQLKAFFIGRINQVLPEPQASFLGGLLIGAKRSIPDELQSYFNKTGTTHMVAVSGYNITIIAMFLMLIAQTLGIGRKKIFWLILVFLAFFLMITGLQASVLRAALMGAVVLLGNYLGRRNKVANALILAAVLMLLFNPKILVYDLGFQLSFLATLGLVYLHPVLMKLTKIENCKWKIVKLVAGDYLLTTLSAIIMTQPLILFQFGKLSLVAPLANILVLPLVPLAMLLGFITGLAAMAWSGLGWVLGWSVWLVLSYIIWVLQNFSALGWAYYEFPKISAWLMAGCYLIIWLVILKFAKSTSA